MIDVDALVADGTLGLTFIAGRAGAIRPVSWVHVVDLEDPWNWVGPGDLLLTTGPGIPPVDGQAEWLTALITSGASGLVVAPRPGVYALGADAVALADAASFPVMAAGFDLKFVDLARRVIDDTLRREGRRLATVHRVYDSYSASLARQEPLEERLRGVCGSVGLGFELFAEAGVRIAATGRYSSLGAGTTIRTLEPPITPFRVELRLHSRDGERIDPALEHSFMTIVVLELQQRVRDRRAGASAARYLVEDLISGIRPVSDAVAALTEGSHPSPVSLLAAVARWRSGGPSSDPAVAPNLWNAPFIGAWQEDTFVMFLDAATEARDDVMAKLGADAVVGLSEPITSLNPPAEAVRQASIAVNSAIPGVPQVFSAGAVTSIIPAAPRECQILAEHYLGPLRAYDAQQGTMLLATLDSYLRNDRAGTAAAAELHIHRHTLMYRLGSISRITGFDPTTSAGTAMFWVALQAAERADWLQPALALSPGTSPH